MSVQCGPTSWRTRRQAPPHPGDRMRSVTSSSGNRSVRPSSLSVIGLGAIGGSLAWQARLAGVPRVIGYSPSRADQVDALRSSAVTELADSAVMAVKGADLVVLA